MLSGCLSRTEGRLLRRRDEICLAQILLWTFTAMITLLNSILASEKIYL